MAGTVCSYKQLLSYMCVEKVMKKKTNERTWTKVGGSMVASYNAILYRRMLEGIAWRAKRTSAYEASSIAEWSVNLTGNDSEIKVSTPALIVR